MERIQWNINSHPQEAYYKGKLITIDVLDQVLMSGPIKLLLPLTSSLGSDAITLLYQVPIKKKQVRIVDVLNTIYNFYNTKKVFKSDVLLFKKLKNYQNKANVWLNQMENGKKFKFIDFLSSSMLSFSGLTTEKNAYLVTLE